MDCAVGPNSAHAHARPARQLARSGPAAWPSSVRAVVFFSCRFRPRDRKTRPKSRAHAPPPRASQAATWAWAGKAPSRMGSKWPIAVSGRSLPSVSIRRPSIIFARIKAATASISQKTLTSFSISPLPSSRPRQQEAAGGRAAAGQIRPLPVPLPFSLSPFSNPCYVGGSRTDQGRWRDYVAPRRCGCSPAAEHAAVEWP